MSWNEIVGDFESLTDMLERIDRDYLRSSLMALTWERRRMIQNAVKWSTEEWSQHRGNIAMRNLRNYLRTATKEQRSASGRKAAQSYWGKLTPEEKKAEIGRRVQLGWAKSTPEQRRERQARAAATTRDRYTKEQRGEMIKRGIAAAKAAGGGRGKAKRVTVMPKRQQSTQTWRSIEELTQRERRGIMDAIEEGFLNKYEIAAEYGINIRTLYRIMDMERPGQVTAEASNG